MCRVFTILLALWFLPLAVAQAASNRSIEIVPFGGYRWSGDISSVGGASNLDVKGAGVFGLALDVNVSENSALELYWSHFTGDWEASLADSTTPTGSISRDDILLGGVWHSPSPGRIARLYISAGFGASIYSSPDAEPIGRVAWSLGGGGRRDLHEKIALRADFRWAPTYVTRGSSQWCDSYNCYPVSSGTLFNQWELSLGLLLKISGQ
jgi:hypothetical protein